MKKTLKMFSMLSLLVAMSSCYTHKFVVGDGPQSGVEVTGKNNFFVYGLIPGKVSDPQALADNAADFEMTESMTFVDGLLGVITLGIYTPTTTTIKK
jgi:hypothetical protein